MACNSGANMAIATKLVVIINPITNNAVDSRSRRWRRICLTDPREILLTAIGKFAAIDELFA